MEDALEAAALRRDLVAAPAPRLSSGVSTFKDSFGLQRALLTPLVALMCIPDEAALRGAPRDALGRRQGGPFDYRALAGRFEDVSEMKFWCATAGRKRSDNQDRHWLLCRLPDTLLRPGAATELASDPGCPEAVSARICRCGSGRSAACAHSRALTWSRREPRWSCGGVTYDSAEYDVPAAPAPGELWRGTSAFLPRERSKEAQDRFPDDLQTLEVMEQVQFFNTAKASTLCGIQVACQGLRCGHGRACRAIALLAGLTERMGVITCLTQSWSEETAGFLPHDALCGCRQAATRFYRDAKLKTERLSVHAPDDYIASPIINLALDKARALDATVSGMLTHACGGLDARPEACGTGCIANAFCMLGGSASTTSCQAWPAAASSWPCPPASSLHAAGSARRWISSGWA